MGSEIDAREIELSGSEIAIIGMSCRFPGAASPRAFWQNLRDGVESISRLSEQDLLAAGVSPELFNSPDYVRAAAIIDDIEAFDAAFFGYTPREAALIDPQQRLFTECAWEALEDAGYDPERYPGRIGIYGGAKTSMYLFNLFSNPQVMRSLDLTEIGLGNDLANLTTRISYKFNLTGPSYALHTACSTSLVAVHLACQSLLVDECRMALAGGVSLNVPQKVGYQYQVGGILSPDGHCRAFDAQTQGTLFGNGAGMVVLKRLEDALADGDTIHAVIKGSASNNDGALKASFTAPGVEGQARVIAEALATGDVGAETISYVETHGTGTTLGDSIEIRALSKVFRRATAARQFCAIGSVKTNIGHLDTAAGISSLIKTVLALRERQMPPSLHLETPNPTIDFPSSPFYVNTGLQEWPAGPTPRRAGVSSFGFGSTNAHVVLEEAPPREPESPGRPWQLLVLSARSQRALAQASANLADYLEREPQASLADVAYTLQVGRRAFAHRRALLCRDHAEALAALRAEAPGAMVERPDPPVALLFPGQGAQAVGMGAGLYQHEPLFRQAFDRCAELLKPQLGIDLRAVIFAPESDHETVAQRLEQTALAQPALFAVEYAMAQLWMSWGLRPKALLGHSIGEYVAACLAGVFSLEDALALAATRGRLMQTLAPGAMLAVSLAEQQLLPLLGDQLDLAAVNGPALCVVSGPISAVEALSAELREREVGCKRLRTSHAFHSRMMEPILEEFTDQVARLELRPPQIPFISNLTGTWIAESEATDPRYWARHLRQTVRFADGLGTLLRDQPGVALEVGPGQTLSGLVRGHPDKSPSQLVLSTLGSQREQGDDQELLISALGQLWLAGVAIDWEALYAQQRRRRIPLPTYPFERQRHWIDAQSVPALLATGATPEKQADLNRWFYLPSWRRILPPAGAPALAEAPARRWLIFEDAHGLGHDLALRLEQLGQLVARVQLGERFEQREAGCYSLPPAEARSYRALLEALAAQDLQPQHIVHCWELSAPVQTTGVERFEQAQDHGFYSLLYLAQALGGLEQPADIQLDVLSCGLHDISGDELLRPEQATLLGACKVITQEHPRISCRSIDVELDTLDAGQRARLQEQLLGSLAASGGESVIAYRGRHCWAQSFDQTELAHPQQSLLRDQGVYLITGGLGGVGLTLAEHLARTRRARLVLIGRSALPDRSGWDEWLHSHPEEDQLSQRIRAIQRLEQLGAHVLALRADVTSLQDMRAAIEQSLAHFGAIHGIVHAAGVAGGGLIQLKTRESAEAVLAPKVRGLLVLEQLVPHLQLDFLALFSSLSSIVGEFGQVDYAAANAYLDAYAQSWSARNQPYTLSINWDTWHDLGMAADANTPEEFRLLRQQLVGEGILPAEGMQVFELIMAQPQLSQVLVSTKDLHARAAQIKELTRMLLAGSALEQGGGQFHPRPDLQTEFVAPRDEFEQTIAAIWQQTLGIEEVGVNDNFFDLGGHSLLITQLLNRLHKAYPVEIPIRTLFESPTIAGMATLVSQLAGQQEQVRPIGELVREVDPEEQLRLLDPYLRKKVAQALVVDVAQLPADGSLAQVDLEGITSELMWNFHQDFRLQVYPHEVRQRRSIGELARFIVAELERVASLKRPVETSPISLYDDYESRVVQERSERRSWTRPASKNKPMVFLHSSPRSGSTLLRVMLAGHPDLFAPPELDILRCEDMSEWMRWMHDPSYGYGFFWASQGLQWAFTKLLGLDDAASKTYLQELADRGSTIQQVYGMIQEQVAPRLLIDKSPSYSLSASALRRAEELFDAPKYIQLVRHPHSVIESLVRLRFDKLFGPVIYGSDQVDPFIVAEKVWVTCNQNLIDFLGQIDPERQLLVRYEDLVSDPATTMQRMCAFLEVPFNNALLQPYDNNPERMISGLGDPNILHHDRVDPALGQAWKKITLPRRLGDPARALASRLGYELPELAAPPLDGDSQQLAQMLKYVEHLSPEEVQAMLEQLNSQAS